MRKLISLSIIILITWNILNAQTPWTERTYMKITLDTKEMLSLDCSLGGGNDIPSTLEKVYAHLGLCTCDINDNQRDCTDESANNMFCISQIQPYQSKVWQHVVGNWGDVPADDGVGLMTAEGDGVYSIEFVIEDYFSSADVSTEGQLVDGEEYPPSEAWSVNEGGKPYVIGMVFRNLDGTSSGRDDLCNDIFIVDILGEAGGPFVIQGYDQESPFDAITLDIHPASIENIMQLSDFTSIYPNPFTDIVNIDFKLVAPENNLNIRVFDMLGKEISTIFQGNLNPGRHIIQWNGKSNNGQAVPEGLYFISLSNNEVIMHTERVFKIK